ncbi:MAG: hypothetical protein MJD61_17720 [Proteobacteria bacterium]|nr:hypothetical protein [Pseudomonadota bacterium]
MALRLSTAGEKTNAAFCFGMAYRDNYRCTFDAANDATLCRGDTTAYAVLFSETASGTIGVVYDVSDQQEIGRLSQAATGEFEIDFTQLGLVGECTVVGDVATLCVRAVTD